MDSGHNGLLDVFCTAMGMKEKKVSLYEEGMKKCPDSIGAETFRMLKEAEQEHLKTFQAVYEDLKKGAADLGACSLVAFHTAEKKKLLRKIATEHGRIDKACLDTVAAIEMGMELENGLIGLFSGRLKEASDPELRGFIERIVTEEREHFRMLADLKFYYTDPENWFLEKGHQVLDGAGGSA